MTMNAAVILSDLLSGTQDEVIIEGIEDRRCFTYTDNQKCNCEFCIYEEGLCFFRQAPDHLLELHLRDKNYARITTEEGILNFDIKVVDFHFNNDILVMHYIVNDEEKRITIKYYQE